eukprot:5246715-Heterocapsa_arctica.AAC.1
MAAVMPALVSMLRMGFFQQAMRAAVAAASSHWWGRTVLGLKLVRMWSAAPRYGPQRTTPGAPNGENLRLNCHLLNWYAGTIM